MSGHVSRLAALGVAISIVGLAPAVSGQDAIQRLSPSKAQPARARPAPAAAPVDPLQQVLPQLRPALAAHGDWIEHPSYGTVWAPRVGPEFTPFVTKGRWAVSETGDWTWVSLYPWGDIPFHYGNWVWTQDRNWVWLPGTEYAPARVVWRIGDASHDYIGWAPMAPARYWLEDAPVRQARGKLPFAFVPSNDLFHPLLSDQVVDDAAHGQEILAHSRVHNGAEGPGSTLPAAGTPPLDVTGVDQLPVERVKLAGGGLGQLLAARAPAAPPPAPPVADVPPYPEPELAPAAAPKPPAVEKTAAPREAPRTRCRLSNTWPRLRLCRQERR